METMKKPSLLDDLDAFQERPLDRSQVELLLRLATVLQEVSVFDRRSTRLMYICSGLEGVLEEMRRGRQHVIRGRSAWKATLKAVDGLRSVAGEKVLVRDLIDAAAAALGETRTKSARKPAAKKAPKVAKKRGAKKASKRAGKRSHQPPKPWPKPPVRKKA